MASKMESLSLICQMAFSLLCFCSLPAKSDESELPAFAFGWLNNDDTFDAGETASIKVIVLGNFDFGKHDVRFKPNVSVNDKMGNSSFVSGMALHLDGPTETWSISFIPIMVGLFNVLIVDEKFRVLDSSLHFHVNPGRIYPAAGVLSWKDDQNEVAAGMKVELLILPKDAFGNNISSSSQERVDQNFTLFASTSEGLPANLTDITNKGWNDRGYLNLEFTAVTAGILLLHVEIHNQTLQGSPLPFKVNPGKLDIQSCVAKWNVETKYFQLFSLMEGFINQHDLYLNRVPGFYDFDIEVIEKGSNLSLPVADLVLGEVSTGILSFSLTLYEPGNFTLLISDREKRNFISGTPFDFTVYVGYCDGETSIVNGSGLNDSIAGEAAEVYVFLKDAYLYPSPVELESLKFEIEHESGSKIDHPIIQVKGNNSAGSFFSYGGRLKYDLTPADAFAPAPLIEPFSERSRHRGSDFEVVYVPEKSGSYEIHVFCGNILLSPTHPFHKRVTPGEVNLSLSGVVNFAERVPKLTKNDVSLRLRDSFRNPVLNQQAKLELAIGSVNGSGSVVSSFSDNHDGSYTATYTAKEVGTYEMCASYDGHGFSPCPFGVNVYDSDYFPKAENDAVSVWEDESVAFDVLENDYFGGSSNASIVEYSQPGHGSLLLLEGLFRYTPYERFYGKDWFSYTISDKNGNAVSGSVDLLIICRPPQFVSIPSALRAVENAVSPRYRGFSGFKILYSDPEENITVALASPSGIVMLSPIQMQFWKAKWDEFSVENHAAEGGRELALVGCLDAINYALQSIRYLGNKNFYGNGVIRVSATNKNGRNDVDIPIDLLAVNDFPVINVPSTVVLDDDMKEGGAAIFGQVSGKFDCIHDPDLAHFPGNRSDFLIFLSMEVSDGVLSTSLPSELINTTEVKLKTSHLWQPIQTFVTISKHFSVKAKGIRFRGSIDDCNEAVKQLSYHEGKHAAALRLTVNDLGNHGCYPDCGETMMSASLVAQKTVNLIQNSRQMSSSLARTLGSIVAIESAAVFLLALLLLIFMCRCTVVLLRENKTAKPTPAIQLQQSSKGKEQKNIT